MTVKTTLKEPTLSDKTTYELRFLTQDVPNPTFDGRKRHGSAAIKTFQARTKFVVVSSIETYGDKAVTIRSIELLDDSGDIYTKAVVEAMIAASAVLQPTTWDETLASLGMSGLSRSTNAQVLEKLFQVAQLRPALLDALTEVMA